MNPNVRAFCLFFLFLAACQTTKLKHPSITLFQGEFSFTENEKKQSYSIEVYVDSLKKGFRMNILSPVNSILAVYVWDSEKHLIMFPLYGKYFEDSKLPEKWTFEKLQNPLWLYKALLRKAPKEWVCEKGPKKVSEKGPLLRKCRIKSLSVEWKDKIFQPSSIHFKFKESKNQVSINLEKKHYPKNNNVDILSVSVPKSFKKVSSFKEINQKF